MFWSRKKSSDRPVWRDETGKIVCPGNRCPQKCEDTCPIWLNTCALEEIVRSQPETAISYLLQAVALAPDFPDAHCTLGSSYGMCGRHQDAYDSFSKALELRKEYPQALRGLIYAEKNLGMFSEALNHCDVLERITQQSAQTLREQIQSCQDQSDPERESWIPLALFLLEEGRNREYIQSEGFTHIPELLVQAEQTCAKIFQGIQEECEDHPEYDCVRLTFVWAALAGMGAVYHWNVDFPALSANGIYETLTAERGLFAMDEYVLDTIGFPFEDDEAKELSSFLYQLSAMCIFKMVNDGIEPGISAVMRGAKAMYAFGMVFEMNRLGMK